MPKDRFPDLDFIKEKAQQYGLKIQRDTSYNLNDVIEVENLKEILELGAQRFENKSAFLFYRDDELMSVSHREFLDDTVALGTAFLEHGFKGKHIAVIGENSYEWILTFFAVACGVGVIVPIDRDLSGEDINALLEKYDIDVVVGQSKHLEKIKNAEVVFPDVDAYISFQGKDEFSLQNFLENGRDLVLLGNNEYNNVEINVESLCAIFSTSGTTGMCKGVMLSQKNMVSVILDACRYIDVGETDKCISVLPYHHTYEFLCGIAAATHAGTAIFINNSMKALLKNLKEQKPTGMVAVSLIVEKIYSTIWLQAKKMGKDKKLRAAVLLSDSLRKTGVDIRRKIFSEVLDVLGGELRFIVSGGSALSPDIIRSFESLGITVWQGYGITECAPLVAVNNKVVGAYDSVGAPITCCDVRIKDGEILVKGANVMLGYYKEESATDDAFDDGWFKTGDLGYIDQKGCIYITGRKKNLIILKNGENVSPEELEMKIQNCDAVEEVIVVAKEPALGSDPVITAIVYVKQDYRGEMSAENTVRSHIDEMNKRMPSYKRIRALEFKSEEFEKTTSHKIKRNL